MAERKEPESSNKKLVSRKEFLVGSGAVLAAIALAACASKTTNSTTTIPSTTSPTLWTTSTPKYGGTYKMIHFPVSANIGWPADLNESLDMQVCLETLLRGDNKGNIIPWLAESYKVADDLKNITFSLRKGVKFHDGSDFNAEVAKWNLDNYINAGSAGGTYWTSIDIIDNYTIRVHLSEWKNIIPASFGDASNAAFIVSKAAFDKNGLDWMRGHPVGTGPFKFDSYTQDASLKFVRNPDYWVKGKPYLDGLEFILINDAITQKMVMESGEADSMTLMSGKDASEFTAKGLIVVKYPAPLGNLVLIPDSGNIGSPWVNQKVREAMEYAIDREAITKAFGYGWFRAAYQLPSYGYLPYDSNFPARRYDLEKAKQLLVEAGYTNGFKTTIITDPSAERDLVVAIQSYIAKVGIEAKLEFTEIGKWISYMGPNGSLPENSVLFSMVTCNGDVTYMEALQWIWNMEGKGWLKPPELNQAYQAALTSETVDTKLVKAVTDLITNDALFIPVYDSIGGIVNQPYLIGRSTNERGGLSYWNPEDIWLNK